MMNKKNIVAAGITPCVDCGKDSAVGFGPHKEALCVPCMDKRLSKQSAMLRPLLQDLGADPAFVDRHEH